MKPIVTGFCFLFLSTYGWTQTTLNTDVLVIGGSTGGVGAAIQSARLQNKTILIEPTQWLGGMLTAAGVSCTDGNDELHSGIWMEFREELYKHYKTRNLFTGWISETCFEAQVGDSIFKAMFKREKFLTVKYQWFFEKALMMGKSITGAVFVNQKGQKLTVNASLVIDATDLGDVFASAGAGFDLGMEHPIYAKETMAPGKSDMIQDLTWVAVLKDYGPNANKTIPRPKNYDSTRYFCSCLDAPCPDGSAYKVNTEKMLDYALLPNKQYMINWPAHGNDYYVNVTSIPQIKRYEYLEAARQQTLGFVYFIQTQLGKKNLGLSPLFPGGSGLALMPYHREGRRVKGEVRLNVNDLIEPFDQNDPLYRTGISVGDYPVDHHHSKEKNPPNIDFPRVPSFSIPLGSLIPKDVENLIVAEKGISVSNIVNGSTRLQPCVLLTGQAAGALAAVVLKERKANPSYSVKQADVRNVQAQLLAAKAYLRPYFDVKPEHPNWISIQRIGVTGILKSRGVPEGWANKTFFDPDSLITENELSEGLGSFFGIGGLSKSNTKITVSNLKAQLIIVMLAKRIKISFWKSNEELQEVLSNRSINSSTALTKAQVAVILDHYLHPFNYPVDHFGRLNNSNDTPTIELRP
ncbi:MAG: FAD-dependent oxidoreductase [Chitinophagaceae bacterium]|uniref:FAD-dependent oxidoreductase n=1 Tax=unclassified Paraflavitalea TaxID=2798305 RepID=UPI003D32A113|nr:FAD-dependent oxidoreductase [Chitinophagaceae bacterium]